MGSRARRQGICAAIAISAALLSACGGSANEAGAGPDATGPAGAAPIAVVASTNVYGGIAKQIGGDRVEVTSIISDPAQDPHSYEASPQTQLALSKAKVVIENGGGYDDFVDTMLKAAKNPAVEVLNAVEISGRTAAAGEELNEHVWYDLATAEKLADRIAGSLAKTDAASAAVFTQNAAAFKQKLKPLQTKAAAIKSAHSGTGVAITEPVPGYLLEACGLENQTPEEFAEAIEEGDDVSPKALNDTLALFTGNKVEALVYNEQTAGPQTERVEQAAKDNGVTVVPVTETLPAGKDYAGWMSDNLTAIESALA